MLLEASQSKITFCILVAQVVVVFFSYLIFAKKLFNPLSPRFYYGFLKRTMGLSILLPILLLSIQTGNVIMGIGLFLIYSFILLNAYLMIRYVIHEMHPDIKKEFEKGEIHFFASSKRGIRKI